MQALELLAPTKLSVNDPEQSTGKSHHSPATPDGEFGRLMEHAMSPDEKEGATPNFTPRKGKAPLAAGKAQPSKGPLNQEAAATESQLIGSQLISAKTEGGKKTKVTSSAPAEPATTPKEKVATGTNTVLPIITDDDNKPLPVFLSLPAAGQFATSGKEAEMAALAGNFQVTQPVPSLGTTKTFPSKSPGPAIAATGKTPTTTLPEKVFPVLSGKPLVEVLSSDPLTTGAKPLEPTPEAKATLPTADQPVVQAQTQAEPVKPNLMALAGLKVIAPALVEEKPQTITPITAKAADSVKNDGMGVATTDLSMKKSEKANKVAGLDMQVLPVGTKDTARETVLPPHAVVIPIRTLDKQSSNSDLNLTMPSASPTTTDTAETSDAIALPSLANAQMRDVERTHDMVSLHALRMVSSTSDSLQMVIKPGAGTELSLELRHRNGGIEAEAVMQQGDFQLMNQHWPELQQKLEQRGIKLAPLGGEENFTTPDNGNFSRQQQPEREEAAQQASAFAEFTVAMNRGGATARLAPAIAGGGWESWA